MMKKYILLICILLLCLCTACTRQETLSDTEIATDTTDAAETETTVDGSYSYVENEDVDNRFPRLTGEELVQVGQYLFGTEKSSFSRFLRCYDLVGKTSEIACGKPDCTHDNAECNAYFCTVIGGSLSLYHDRLYWLGIEKEGNKDYAIRCMDPFTGTRQVVRSIDWTETMVGYNPQRIRVHRGTAYLECVKQEIKDSTQPGHKLSLLAMPLSEKGETKVLFERNYECWTSMQVRYCGNYIYLFCTLWTSDLATNWYEIYRVDIQSEECATVVSKLEPDCFIDDFWIDEDGRILASGKEKSDPEEAKVWKLDDDGLTELFAFEKMKNSWPLLFDHIAVNMGAADEEVLCCIRDYNGDLLFDGKLTQPTQIPDMYLPKCKIRGYSIIGGDRDRFFLQYMVSDNNRTNDVVTVMYDVNNNMEPAIIWQEHEDGAFGF
ncbi:MAG: hypothetical protein IJK47_04410 [Lachnospiraceae bacterium]|nr:hypothetical protein [Lachnospiraceae bacterium]